MADGWVGFPQSSLGKSSYHSKHELTKNDYIELDSKKVYIRVQLSEEDMTIWHPSEKLLEPYTLSAIHV